MRKVLYLKFFNLIWYSSAYDFAVYNDIIVEDFRMPHDGTICCL